MENHLIDEVTGELYPAPAEPSGGTSEPERLPSASLNRQDMSRLLDEAEYFLDVMGCGYDQAVSPHDPDGCTRRTRRLELGIDVPELDAVCMWATCNKTGISVPCVEFMAFQTVTRLRRVLTALEAGESGVFQKSRASLDLYFHDLLAVLPDIKMNREFPVLGDRFLPPEVLKIWCARDGEIRRLLGLCKRALGMEISS